MLLKRVFLRQPNLLSIHVLCTDKKILLRGIYGSFKFPINSKFKYSSIDKKLWFRKSSYLTSNILNLSSILLSQVILGILLGYRKQLNVIGIGYQAEVYQKNTLVLKLGFSHSVHICVPKGIAVLCPKPRIILLKGINLKKVNNFASTIRKIKLPSTYKEKGIYFAGEPFLIKQGKKT